MKKYKFEISTLISAVLFGIIIICMSVTSLAGKGNANYWGSRGTIYSLIMVVLMYIIPMVLYELHIRSMKYILAFVIAIFTIGTVIIYTLIVLFEYSRIFTVLTNFSRENIKLCNPFCDIVVKIICPLEIACNIVWFIINVKRNKNEKR